MRRKTRKTSTGARHEPGVFPYKDRGGRHEKPDTDDKDQKGGKDNTK